jgi:3-oxoacyl-[acyl-carrier-protein] synthase III
MECLKAEGAYTEASLEFMKKLLVTSGVGPKTAWPPSITRALEGLPRLSSSEQAREESKTVVFEVVREVFEKTKLTPKDIDILIINCSLFSPTPSLCALVIHEFNMRSDVLSYNLSGMVYSSTLPPVSLSLS